MGEPQPGQTASSISSSIDIEQLVEKVYQLMRNDARLERARGKKPERRGQPGWSGQASNGRRRA